LAISKQIKKMYAMKNISDTGYNSSRAKPYTIGVS